MSESVFNKPAYLSDSQYSVIQRVAYFVAMSEDTARYQRRLLEKTRHLPSFNFIRDPTTFADVIRENTVNSTRPLSNEQLTEVHRLYTNYLNSYRHNKAYIQQTLKASAAASGYGGQRYHVDAEDDNAYSAQLRAPETQRVAVPTEDVAAEVANTFEPPVNVSRISQHHMHPAGSKRSRTPVDDDDE